MTFWKVTHFTFAWLYGLTAAIGVGFVFASKYVESLIFGTAAIACFKARKYVANKQKAVISKAPTGDQP